MSKHTRNSTCLEDEFNEFTLKIDALRDSTSIILNKFHGLDESKHYWWFLAGYYAVIAWAVIKRCEDNRNILKHLIDEGPLTAVIPLELNDRLEVFRHEFSQKKSNNNNNLNHNIASMAYISLDQCNNSYRINDVYQSVTTLIYKFYLKFIDLHNKFLPRKNLTKRVTYNLDHANSHDLFEELLLFFLPEIYKKYFPKIFIKIAKYINLNKIYTTHGLDLNIFQVMIIGSNYEKKGPGDWLNIVGHGFGSNISIDSIYYHSLQNKPQNAYSRDILKLPSFQKKNKNPFNVLLIPAERPLPYMLYDLHRYEVYEKLCVNLVEILSGEKYNSLAIKVRFKNSLDLNSKKNDYLKKNIKNEKRSFEEAFNDYDLIITTNIASVAGKCIFNNIPFIGLYFPYELTEKANYDWIVKNKDIYENYEEFIERVKAELERMVRNQGF
jgi:hypothetical protein